jgi:hypothetical protein
LGIFFLVIVVKAIAGDRLAIATRTWLEVAADKVTSATLRTTIITRRMVEIIFAVAVTNTRVILTTDAEFHGFDTRTPVAMPPGLFAIPRHANSPNDPSAPTRPDGAGGAQKYS